MRYTGIDYDPFGMLLVDRTWQSTTTYKYGFNGQEQDNEIYGNGNLNTAEFWEYDTRLGRRWNRDPLIYEWRTPYSCFNNNPLYFKDLTGAIPQIPNKDGRIKQAQVKFDGKQGKLSEPLNIGSKSGKISTAGAGEDATSSVKGEPGAQPQKIGNSDNPEINDRIKYSYEKIMFQTGFTEDVLVKHFEIPFYCGSDNHATLEESNDLYKTMNRFLSGTGGTFSDYQAIELAMAENKNTSQTQLEIKKEFLRQLKYYNGDYSKICITTINPTDFSGTTNLLSTCPGGTQLIEIYLVSVVIHNNTVSAEIKYELHDDFGVAQRDVKSHPRADFWCSAVDGLAAFWVLQHIYGYKPLYNIYTISFSFTSEF